MESTSEYLNLQEVLDFLQIKAEFIGNLESGCEPTHKKEEKKRGEN